MKIEIKILNKEFFMRHKLGGDYYDIPIYQTTGSAAMDLYCTEDITIYPGEVKQIKTGLAIWIASDFAKMQPVQQYHCDNDGIGSVPLYSNLSIAGLILPRSGLGSKGLILANTIGLIDEDYQGELLVNVWNRTREQIERLKPNNRDIAWQEASVQIDLKEGDRFAQLMFVPVIKAKWKIVNEFSNITERNNRGLGSTGD